MFSLKPALKSRAEVAVNSLEMKLKFRKSKDQTEETDWVHHAELALGKARQALRENDSDEAWNYIHLADEFLIWGLDDAEIPGKASSLRAEGVKINGSRGVAMLKILGEEGANVSKINLQEALAIRNDHYSTKYHKIKLRRSSLLTLSWILSLVVTTGISWIAFLNVCFPTLLNSDTTLPPFWQEAISGLFMGVLGASFSMAYTMTTSSLEVKIPDQIMGAMITLIRLIIGGTASFVALLILRAGMLEDLLSARLLKSHLGFLVIAFIAGFSERWIIQVVQVISREPKKN